MFMKPPNFQKAEVSRVQALSEVGFRVEMFRKLAPTSCSDGDS